MSTTISNRVNRLIAKGLVAIDTIQEMQKELAFLLVELDNLQNKNDDLLESLEKEKNLHVEAEAKLQVMKDTYDPSW